MTDLHTHILPGVDDGANNTEMSLKMLRMEREQEVDAVALTPHFYRDVDTPDKFFERRRRSYKELNAAIRQSGESFPKLFLGAEVAWLPGMSDWEELEELCYENTRYILIEPPFRRWQEVFFTDIAEMIDRRGITPVVAHIDRYFKAQPRQSLERLYGMQIPVQISTAPFFSMLERGRAIRSMRSGRAQLLISDCHNTTTRKPNIGMAVEILEKKLGNDIYRFLNESDYLLED